MINVLIVDDHVLFREGVKLIINSTDDFRVTGEANNGMEALNLINKNKYDIILLDISMPGRNGLDVLKEIKRIDPDQHVLILTMYSEKRYALRAMKIGASGYLTKAGASEELLNALKTIASGEMYINSNVLSHLVFELRNDDPKPEHERLSSRELQIMEMIVAGKRNKEISEELALSISTVSTYRSQILKKLHLKNNIEIIQYAIEHQLFSKID